MISIICINYTLKKSKILANGTAPVYLRITVNSERTEFTTKRYVIPCRWNAASQKMTGNTEEARAFNHYLKTLEQQVFDAHRQMIEAKISVTANSLRDRLSGKQETIKVKMLLPIFKEHNRRIAALIGMSIVLELWNATRPA